MKRSERRFSKNCKEGQAEAHYEGGSRWSELADTRGYGHGARSGDGPGSRLGIGQGFQAIRR